MNRKFLCSARLISLALVLSLLLCTPAFCADKVDTIKFGDLSWDSVMVHNRIAAFIVEHGMGYKTDFIPGGTEPTIIGLAKGDIHVDMESWTENIQKVYDKYTSEGKIIDLGSNFGNSWQGWLVPTYMIKGDPERGIKATAPDLKHVEDLPKYKDLFKDPEQPEKGRFYNGIAGWAVTEENTARLKAYGLDEYFTDFIPGSDAALAGSMAAAYKRGKPWFGYYWAPTPLLGKLDMTALEEIPYDEHTAKTTHKCALFQAQCNILVNHELPAAAPDVVDMLKKYETTLALNNEFLAHMDETKSSHEQTAVWFMKKYPDLWKTWVTPEVAGKVQAALDKM